MQTPRPLRFWLAASVALAAVSGCVVTPTGSQASSGIVGAATPAAALPTATKAGTATATKPTAGSAFATKTETAAVTSATAITGASTAKALAVNDEALMESASAAMEDDEQVANYALAAVGPARRASTVLELGFLGGEGMQGLRQPPEPPRPQPQPRGGRQATTVVNVNVNVNIVVVKQAQALNQRRTVAKKQQAAFVKENPKYNEEVEAIRKVLDAQPWQPNADDADTVFKSGTSSLKLATGASRKVSVLRVVTKTKPHHLVHGVTDLADVKADGSQKTIHWEKALQDDGSFDITYHHDSTNAKGERWVTDWTKTLNADGTIVGKGTFTSYDADGAVLSEEVLTIGGTDADGQVIEEDEDEDAAADETATTTEETATEDEAATEEEAVADEEATAEEDETATEAAAADEADVSTEG